MSLCYLFTNTDNVNVGLKYCFTLVNNTMLTFMVLIINLLFGNVVSKQCQVPNFDLNTDNHVAKCLPKLNETADGKLVADPLTVCVVNCKTNPLRQVSKITIGGP